MKQFIIPLALASAIALAAPAQAAPVAASPSAQAEVLILVPLTLVSVNDLKVGRNVSEVLRVLDALQTDELCPCNWKDGEPTLRVA